MFDRATCVERCAYLSECIALHFLCDTFVVHRTQLGIVVDLHLLLRASGGVGNVHLRVQCNTILVSMHAIEQLHLVGHVMSSIGCLHERPSRSSWSAAGPAHLPEETLVRRGRPSSRSRGSSTAVQPRPRPAGRISSSRSLRRMRRTFMLKQRRTSKCGS